jgi:hypothetical protein
MPVVRLCAWQDAFDKAVLVPTEKNAGDVADRKAIAAMCKQGCIDPGMPISQ